MRNLKRALSLALASVMLLGMMVVGSSAKGLDDFSDNAEIVNKDAVAVTSAIGLFDGYEDGSFGPENVVTRAEMAVIICTMLYGAGVNVNQFAETNVFTDVPAWAQGYVNLCSSLGIVAGVGDGKFDPNATVTTAQAVLMLCRALGYFQSAADFGDNWMLAATAKGTALGLYGDLKLAANEGLTRDNVAELVFNALTKAVPVQYNELLGVYYNENKGILYSLTYYYTDTLGYKNFDLVYKTNENTDYGRPGTTWGIGSYRMDGNPSGEGNKEGVLNEDGSLIPERVKMTSDDEIITVADTPDFTYTANTKENVIYKAVGKSVVDDYTWNVYVDGAEQAGDDLAPANDKDTDYAALMERAAQRGDNAAAAIYEQQRNAKIRGEGMTDVTQSNDYAQYLPLEDVPDYDDTHRRQAESLLTERDTTGQRARIDQMLDALLGEEFDYDPASDKLYAAYRQQYERQADLASANALGAAAALTGGRASTAAVAAAQQAGGYYRAMLAGKLPELAQLAYERYNGERKTRLSAIDAMLDAADSRDSVTKAQIAALLDMDDADYDHADSKLQQQAKDAADRKAAADKKAKEEKAAQEAADKAARSEARRQITLILRNGGTVPDDLWQQSGYNAVTIAAMLRGRKG